MRRRLTLVLVAVVAVALGGFAWTLFASVRQAAWAQHDRALAGRVRALAALVEYDDGYEFELAGAVGAGLGRASRASYFEVWAPDGTVIARSISLEGGDLPREAGTLDAPRFRDVRLPDGRPGRLVGVRVAPLVEEGALAPPGDVTLVLAEDTADVRATVADVRDTFWIGALVTLALVALATALTVARGLRPLVRLAATLDGIDDRRLSVRLPVDGQPAELQVPVRTLNALLARLDESFARERRFTADVSHELRTPLAGLRTLLDVTAQRERGAHEYRRAIADATAIAVQMSSLVENLLCLARLDAGSVELARGEVRLHALVDDAWRDHAALAARRGLTLRNLLPDDAVATTDRDKLRIVLANLLGNAAEYTAEGGWIEVRGDGATLDVVDSGPPISAADLVHVFDRLYRIDPSRTGAHQGIGLSLSRTLCTALGYTLTADCPDGTVRFRIARS